MRVWHSGISMNVHEKEAMGSGSRKTHMKKARMLKFLTFVIYIIYII